MKFNELQLDVRILDAIKQMGYAEATKIQELCIPTILEKKDVFGCAQTGTGKTAAFSLPIIQNIEPGNKIKALILAPTRELAMQINDNIVKYSKYTKLKTTVIYGGVKQKRQVDKIKKGIDILVATPGRLLDLVNQRFIRLDNVEYFVLDEADNMLDMGFIPDINKIVALLPKERCSLCFSATASPAIKKLANSILKDPLQINASPISSTVEKIKQQIYYVAKDDKDKLLLNIMEDKKNYATLIFTRTKRGADRLSNILSDAKFKVASIHSDKPQRARQRIISEFKSGKINTLVATDVASRGLDISDLSFVINYEMPDIEELYVHRIGRTGRAGNDGLAISLVSNGEKRLMRRVEDLIDKRIEVVHDHICAKSETKDRDDSRGKRSNNGRGNNNRNSSNGSNRDKQRNDFKGKDALSNKNAPGKKKTKGKYADKNSSSNKKKTEDKKRELSHNSEYTNKRKNKRKNNRQPNKAKNK
ncbi:MAG: DEAD/DEAH box helicase [Bacilli bacterium]|jgi:ATP-dependent RNA helicase RhlE|nr:DEAD/DEAH box helicase [Bacilli bacterium]